MVKYVLLAIYIINLIAYYFLPCGDFTYYFCGPKSLDWMEGEEGSLGDIAGYKEE